MAMASPACTWYERPLTAWIMVSFWVNRVCRSCTSRRVSVTGLLLGIECIAQAVADPREREHGEGKEEDGREDEVRRHQYPLQAVLDHRAPRGRRRLDTEADQRESGLRHDGPGDTERHRDQERPPCVGHDV